MLRQTPTQTWCTRFLLALAPFLLPATATAAKWVQVSPFDWIDTDSITRSGNFTAYTSVHALESPATTGASGSRDGVDCATGREYWQQQGQFVPLPDDDPDFSGYMSASDPRFRFLCPQQAASAASKPAAQPAKPPPPIAPKGQAQSDVKECETYNPKKTARIAACTRVIESPNPGFADLVSAHHNRCLARFLADEKPEAVLPDCDRAVLLDPKSTKALQIRGAINSRAGRFDAAIADFTQAIALDPNNSQFYGNRAGVYMRKKDLKKAIADFTTERNLSTDADEAYFRMTLCYARVELNVELDAALADCERAVRVAPKDSYAYERRGLARLRMGNLKEARADADKALALDKKNARALYLRALVSAREGKTMASYGDYAAATKTQDGIAKDYDDIGLKLIVQAESAPFCPALTALIKAAAERAASNAKADVAIPGATYCKALDRGYGCNWQTGAAQAAARQKVLAASAGACLTGYVRTDSNASTGPSSRFEAGKTTVVVGAAVTGKTGFDSVAAAVSIEK